MKSLLLCVLFAACAVPATAQHCLEVMSAAVQNRADELYPQGDGKYRLSGQIDELEWRVTFHAFKQKHARLNIVAMEAEMHWSDHCFHYLENVTIATVPIVPSADVRAPFATVVLGHDHRSVKELLKYVARSGARIGRGESGDTDITLKLVPIAQEPRLLTLAVVTPAQMGFSRDVLRSDVYAQAAALGFELCPAEAALALRAAYTTQPRDEHLVVAMEPIQTPSRFSNWKLPRIIGLDVGDDGTRWLVTHSSLDDDYIRLNQKLVFALTK